MKKIYTKPFIMKQTSGYMNKFGSIYQKNYRSNIAGVSIEDIVAKADSPVFVFDEKKIRQTYRNAQRDFSNRYPKFQFSWSYKTNYLDAICSIFHQEGSFAEVVSEFEYEKARRIGVPGNKIIYNGPFKPYNSLLIAFKENAMVHIDNFDELYEAEKAAREIGKKVKIGIRLNMDTGTYPQWSRFGFNLEDGSALNAVKRISKSESLILNGLHAHIGTFMLETNAYQMEVQKMISFMRDIQNNYNFLIEYLDFGGGFPSKNKLKGTYLPPEVSVPQISEYIEAITDVLLSELKPQEYPMVYLETGRALIDEAGYLITTIEGVKQLPHGSKSYIIDAGVNFLYTSTWYNYKCEVDRSVNGTPENTTVYGPLCMNIDVVLENVSLPPLTKGMRLILSPMGAYNVTQWMQFIRYRPAIVLITEDKKIEIIRRAEKLEDIITPERVPEHLSKFNL